MINKNCPPSLILHFCWMTLPSPRSNTWCVPVCGKGTLSCPLSAKGGQGSTPTQTLARHYTAMNRSDTQNADRLAGGWGARGGWVEECIYSALWWRGSYVGCSCGTTRALMSRYVWPNKKKKVWGEAWHPHPHLLFNKLFLPLNRLHLSELTVIISLVHLYSLHLPWVMWANRLGAVQFY